MINLILMYLARLCLTGLLIYWRESNICKSALYNCITSDQEEEDAHDTAKPLHLKPSGCSLTPVLYPECTEILQLINIIEQQHIL